MKKLSIVIGILSLFATAYGQQVVQLPEPQKTGGMPLMEALSKRSTARAFDTKELSQQQLSNLLWAAWGINRPDGKRTAPSSRNKQEAKIYVLLKEGAYVYDAASNQLKQVLSQDIREMGGMQPFVKDAPVTLVFVSDLSKMGEGKPEDKMNTANIDIGYISQNVYLYCASDGLVTGARGSVDKEKLAPKLNLRPDEVIILAQSVGYALSVDK